MAKGAKLIKRRNARVSLPSVSLRPYLKPFVMLIAAFGAGSSTVIASQTLVGHFQIERVEVEGDLVHMRPGDVQSRVDDMLLNRQAHGDLETVKTLLESKPWVAQARVRRVWPSALQIELVEQRPVARWNETQFLGMSGELFEPAEEPLLALPRISGPAGQEAEMYKQFVAWHQELGEVGLELTGLAYDLARGWQLSTASGLTLVLGRQAPEQRLERFYSLWAARLATMPGLQQVDLRYDNAASLTLLETENGQG